MLQRFIPSFRTYLSSISKTNSTFELHHFHCSYSQYRSIKTKKQIIHKIETSLSTFQHCSDAISRKCTLFYLLPYKQSVFIGVTIKLKMHHLLTLTVFLQVLYLAHSQPHPSFVQWKSQMGKSYADRSEEHYRTYIYNKNVEKIKQHNSDPLRTYEEGVNQFTDMTADQFALIYLTVKPRSPSPQVQKAIVSKQTLKDDSDHPIVGDYIIKAVNWTRIIEYYGPQIPSVRSQGRCGSCWAFTAVTTMEYVVAVQFNKIASLSTQQLVSCANEAAGYDSQGCNGGWMPQAFRYGKKYNISSQSQYPYISDSGNARSCDKAKRGKGKYRVSDFNTTDSNYKKDTLCTPMLQALKIAPYSVVINANTLQKYKSGIFSSKYCNKEINHAVVLVGNDKDGNWILQNSWGKKWGQGGYFRLANGNTCYVCKWGAMAVTMAKP